MNNVEYTSDTLCHFVGRSLPNDDARYDLLLKIIKEDGTLYANGENQPSEAILTQKGAGKKWGDLFDKCSCVCFCDIPDNALKPHRKKYSFFGLGFERSFLIAQGARPVMYVPQNFAMRYSNDRSEKVDPFDYYDNFTWQIYSLMLWPEIPDMDSSVYKSLNQAIAANPKLAEAIKPFIETPYPPTLNVNGLKERLEKINRAWWTQCAYIKIFDPTLESYDEKNYYMEREWRCLYSVPFSIKDIYKIYVPNEKYALRIKKDIPQFSGEIVDGEGRIVDL